jgi:AraC-like DNA-binding protein
MRLTTDPLPPRDRGSVVREVFGREIMNLELEPDPDVALRVDFRLRALPGLKLVSGSANGVRSRRTKALLADSNDDLFLSINDSPTERFFVGQRNQEAALGEGDAILMTCAETAWFRRSMGRSTGICVPRSVFAHVTPAIEDKAGKVIPRHSEPLRLLRGYVSSLEDDDALATPELRHLTVSHVHDLLVLALATVGDRSVRAARNGLKAARLAAIKRYIDERLSGGDLSISAVALAHGITERYLQRLFEAEGITFSLFIGHQRLARAHRLLRDPRRSDSAISTIAYECGFGDISHFNRMFRRLYGLSPSELRGDRTDDHA